MDLYIKETCSPWTCHGLRHCELRFCHAVSSRTLGLFNGIGAPWTCAPVIHAPSVCLVMTCSPWTCAPERPVRHGLVAGYDVASSGSATPSPSGSKTQDLYTTSRAPWTSASERHAHSGLVSGYIAASSGSTTSSPPETKAPDVSTAIGTP